MLEVAVPRDRARQIQDLIDRRQLKAAAAVVEKELREKPHSADAHYFAGVVNYLRGEIGGAVGSLKKSLELDPRHTDAAICLSVLYNDIGKYDAAKKVFDQANQSVSLRREGEPADEIERKFAVKHLELADLYFRYRRYDEAIEEYSKAAMLDPLTPDIRIRRAKAYAKKGYVSRAIQELQQLKTENAGYLPARIQLGLLHYSQGNVLDAELEWEGVLQVDHANREAAAYLDMAAQSRQKR